jgi:acylphosphatase
LSGGRERARIVVSGRVQGVGYRDSARYAAQRLSLTGYVKNLPDRAVEIVAEGERAALEQFVAWARRGPPAARVTSLHVDYGQPTGSYPDFTIAY